MAKPAWSLVHPTTGSGNGTVNIGASVHTGRVQRSGTITYKATGAANALQTVTQTAKNEFVAVNDVSAPKEGGNVTITGKSNSHRLSLALGNGDISITLPSTYSAGGASTTNGADIAGDPGAVAEFDFSVTIAVPANGTIFAKSRSVSVTAAGGQSASSTINQAAGDPALSVSPTAITLDAAGTEVSITVTSNTNWTVE
jgi:hypothetical protein